jgi:hypothetical protein
MLETCERSSRNPKPDVLLCFCLSACLRIVAVAYGNTQNLYVHSTVPVDPAFYLIFLTALAHQIIPWAWTYAFVFTKIILYSYTIDL